MKQYTTPTVTVTMEGQSNLLAIADSVTVAIKKDFQDIVVLEDDRLTIEGDAITFSLTEDETGTLGGTSKVEVTIKTGELVYKSDTMLLKVVEAVYDSRSTDD